MPRKWMKLAGNVRGIYIRHPKLSGETHDDQTQCMQHTLSIKIEPVIYNIK